jgi:cell division protein FtsZ
MSDRHVEWVPLMGMGSASGEHRAREAAEKAIACPLLEDINLQGARGILVNISAADMGVAEFNEVGNIVHEFASEDAIIKIGMAIDPSLDDEIKVTVWHRNGHRHWPLAPVKMMQNRRK